MSEQTEKRLSWLAWLAFVYDSALKHGVFRPADVLTHATPDILANHLPPELLSKVLAASLAAGTMTPERVLETVTPQLLALHLPHDVLWACIAAAAARAGVTTGAKPNGKGAARKGTAHRGRAICSRTPARNVARKAVAIGGGGLYLPVRRGRVLRSSTVAAAHERETLESKKARKEGPTV